MTSHQSPDVIVVGGGVIGCSIAYHLAREGVTVAVLDRGEIGGEASSAAAGMLAPLAEMERAGPLQDLGLASLRLFPELAAALQRDAGVDIEHLASGILRVVLTEDEEAYLRGLASDPAAELELHWLAPNELRDLEPALSPAVRGALYSPEEQQVNADRLVQALARAASAFGAALLPQRPVTRLLTRNGRIEGIRTPTGDLFAGHVVLAAGPWTATLAAPIGVNVPVFPVRGQMMAFPSRSALRHVVWASAGYLVPKANGLVFAGATVEKVGFRRNTTTAGLAGLKRMASSLVPRLAAIDAADSWAGLRPGSPDGLPILGPLPGWERLSVASGHYRNGILLAPITGQLIARSIIDGSSNEALSPFSAARFVAAS
ncbi:MAG: glycine oxidase ThiO [Dehalococcoidia bacterium]|jgi:glycine oxidase